MKTNPSNPTSPVTETRNRFTATAWKKHCRRLGIMSVGTTALLAWGTPLHAATVVQTANDGGVGWNSSTLWGGTAPTVGNSYVSAGGFYALNDSHVGSSTTGRLRYVTSGSTFGGDSLTLVANTEILVKAGGTMTGNIILNGGIIRSSFAPSGSFTLAGTLNVFSAGWLGVDDNDAPTMTIDSIVTGAGMLHLASGREVGTGDNTIRFTGDLSGFTGTLNLGGGSFDGGLTWAPATLDFNQDYTLSASLVMGQYGSQDVLNLDQNLTFSSFQFGATSLAAGTYTATDLNGVFGNGSQFINGGGTLTVVPEPSTFALAGLGLVALLSFRRRN